jgi:hypothetical protein
MTSSLTFACLWVLAAAGCAMLPMPRQMVPGLILLSAAPVLIGWIGWQHGALWAFVALAGFVSMFRRPLLYLARRLVGQQGPAAGGGRK